MTKTDLRWEYKRDIGFYPVAPENHTIDLLDCEEQYKLIDYTQWLEEQLISSKTQIEELKSEIVTLKSK